MCQQIGHFIMTKALTIIALLFLTLAHRQVMKEVAYKNVDAPLPETYPLLVYVILKGQKAILS